MIVIRSDEHMSVIRGPADPEGAEVDWEVMERHAKTEMSMVGRDGAQVERQTRQNSAWRGEDRYSYRKFLLQSTILPVKKLV